MTPAPLIIVGSGIAGLWTALHARDRHVMLITAGSLGDQSSTGWAQGGVAAALEDSDSPALHAQDTLSAGAGLVDARAARILAEAGPDEIRALQAMGTPFEFNGAKWALSREAAHSRARVARIKGDQAGAGILATLMEKVRVAAHIRVFEHTRVEALLATSDGGCGGVLARRTDNALMRIEAPDTVLATGSVGGLYAVTTTPWSSQGDALAMAARLGAVIRDAEFVQFHPTAINIGRDPAPLATEALRGEGATLIDRHGERFMRAVHDNAELAPRDVVARAVHRQNQSGKGAFLDARTAVGPAFPDEFPAVFEACMSADIDPRTTPIPVAPATHYHMGGVETDFDGRTSVVGLWAVGECASNGLHGANRLASNSLLDGLVFGRRAANVLNQTASKSNTTLSADPVAQLPDPAHQRLRQIMSAEAGVERTGTGLMRLLGVIENLEARYGSTNALIAARFVGHSALMREESRGGHFRRDFPNTNRQAEPSRFTLADLKRHNIGLIQAAGHAE